MVVDAGKTRAEIAQRAKQAIENAGGRIVGVVMNRVSTRGGSYYYYYRQYYSQESQAAGRATGKPNATGGLGRWFGGATRR
jgi:Mrp family chromosome partitioning ATPase